MNSSGRDRAAVDSAASRNQRTVRFLSEGEARNRVGNRIPSSPLVTISVKESILF